MTEQHTSKPHTIEYPNWQGAVEAALNEPERKKLLERVHAAETAIYNRLQELAQSAEDASHRAERQAITEACRTLLILKRDKLGFPAWEMK